MVVSTPVDVSNRQTTIVSSDWCKNSTCETQGILKSGFLKSASQNDNPSHYFTTSTTLAVERAAHRKMTFFFSPVFICEVETSKVIKGVYPDTNYVKEDYEITPCYLAIILNSDTNTIRQIRRVADLY
ncbi:hypothetical protein BGW38_007331 [Lunasporangiospora selenospora]|uniref:Uncharacterized protein n=1 Tax=Lunasporangiospora selenospora TaxID=979761 RepID=A0A9P6FZQ5_9FUNG|nr:hypothetical protein BGW38_007331 [Lunasporangiospora selenospora]